MTACVIMNPAQSPVMISDIALSYTDKGVTLFPGETWATSMGEDWRIKHARKHYHLSKDTCISVSGRLDQIAAMLFHVQQNLQKFEMLNDQTQTWYEIVSAYPEIDAILCYVDPKSTSHMYYRSNTKHLVTISEAFCSMSSIGSGGQSLLGEILHFEDEVETYLMPDEISQTASDVAVANAGKGYTTEQINAIAKRVVSYRIVRSLFAHLTARKLLRGMNDVQPQKDRHWGGFFEFSYYDMFNRSWRRQDSHIYFFHEILFDKDFELRSLGRVAVYYPGNKNGAIHIMDTVGPDKIHVLQDIRSFSDDFDLAVVRAANPPKFATATLVAKDIYDKFRILDIHSTGEHQQSDIIFRPLPKNKYEVGLKPDWIAERYRSTVERVVKRLWSDQSDLNS